MGRRKSSEIKKKGAKWRKVQRNIIVHRIFALKKKRNMENSFSFIYLFFFFFFEKVYNATYHSVGNFYNAYRCVTRIERSNL